jgi:hypothetical protein
VKKPVESSRASVKQIIEKQVDGYIVSVVPQPMAWDVSVPACILCGRRKRPYLDLSEKFLFMTEIEETSLWISRGITRSQLHYDKENALNCLISGQPKEWLLLDTRKYHDKIPWVRGGGFNGSNDLWNKYTDWVGVDVNNVDLRLHRYLLEVEFEAVTQNPGDCIFLPYSMLHFAGHAAGEEKIANYDELHVAVSYMWMPETDFDPSSCHDILLHAVFPPLPLAVFDTVWYFSGNGSVPQGNQDPKIIAKAVLGDDGTFNAIGIAGFLPRNVDTASEGFLEVLKILKYVEILHSRNISIPLDLWLELSAAADMNSLGCNEGHTYVVRPLEEMNRMLSFMNVWLGRV